MVKFSEYKIDHGVFESNLNSKACVRQMDGWEVINVSSPYQTYDCSGIQHIDKAVDIVYRRPIEITTGVMTAGEENAETS